MEISGPWGTVSERSGLVSPPVQAGVTLFLKKRYQCTLGCKNPLQGRGRLTSF